MNKKQQKRELEQIKMKLEKGLNGIYYKEFRRASLFNAYTEINTFINKNKNCALEWYLLRQATRDTVITFSSRHSLTAAIRNLEEALHE